MTENSFAQENDQGSFSSGLLVGFLAGAVGYFLSQTKEGKEIREKISDHWHELRESLIAEGKLTENECDIPDYIRAARNKISEFIGEFAEDEVAKKTVKKKSVKRKKRIFKGV